MGKMMDRPEVPFTIRTKDHATVDFCEDGTVTEREQTDEELYPRTMVFFSKNKVIENLEGA